MPSFPTFSTGVRTEYGYKEKDNLYTGSDLMDNGLSTNYNLSGTLPKRTFTVKFSQMLETDMNALESFWASMGGRVGTFDMTDDDGTLWPKCRFDQDALTFEYQGPHQVATEVRIYGITTPVLPTL